MRKQIGHVKASQPPDEVNKRAEKKLSDLRQVPPPRRAQAGNKRGSVRLCYEACICPTRAPRRA